MKNFRVILDLGLATKGTCFDSAEESFRHNLLKYRKIWMPRHLFLPKDCKNERCFGCDGVNIVQNNGVAAGQDGIPFSYSSDPEI